MKAVRLQALPAILVAGICHAFTPAASLRARSVQDSALQVDAIVGRSIGDVRLGTLDGRSAIVRVDAPLRSGDTLVTGAGRARLDLLAAGGGLAELTIGPNTTIVMTVADSTVARPPRTHPRAPRITAGAMHWVAAQRPAVPVLLGARFATAFLVPRSADFIVVYDPLWNQGSIYLREGGLTVHLPDTVHEVVAGQAVAVFQGHVSSIAPLDGETWAQLVATIDGPAIAGAGYDITFRDFASGPIGGGDGETRFDGTVLDVTAAAARQAWFPLAAEQVDGYTARAIITLPDSIARALAGLYLTAQDGADCADGDIFFGRDARGILLQSCEAGAWNDRSIDSQPALGDASRFHIERAGDLHVFRLDDTTVATIRIPDRPPDFILFFVGPGARATIRDWHVSLLR